MYVAKRICDLDSDWHQSCVHLKFFFLTKNMVVVMATIIEFFQCGILCCIILFKRTNHTCQNFTLLSPLLSKIELVKLVSSKFASMGTPLSPKIDDSKCSWCYFFNQIIWSPFFPKDHIELVGKPNCFPFIPSFCLTKQPKIIFRKQESKFVST